MNVLDKQRVLTILDLGNISNHYVSHRQLDNLASTHHLELLFLLDATLKTPELFLFAPVIEGSDEHHAHHRQQDGSSLYPAGLSLPLVLCSCIRCPARCTRGTRDRSTRQKMSKGHTQQVHRTGLFLDLFYSTAFEPFCFSCYSSESL